MNKDVLIVYASHGIGEERRLKAELKKLWSQRGESKQNSLPLIQQDLLLKSVGPFLKKSHLIESSQAFSQS